MGEVSALPAWVCRRRASNERLSVSKKDDDDDDYSRNKEEKQKSERERKGCVCVCYLHPLAEVFANHSNLNLGHLGLFDV